MNYLKVRGGSLEYFRKKSQLLIIALVVGFLFGILYVNINMKQAGVTTEISQRFFLERFEKIKVIPEYFFWYVARARLLLIAMILIMGCFKWKRVALVLWCGWIGLLFGTLVVSVIIQIGIKGLFVVVVGMFPHMFFYIPAYVIFLRYIYEYPRKQWNWQKTVFMTLTILIGVVLESYLNPLLMKLVTKMI